MKKIYTTLALILFFTAAFAQWGRGTHNHQQNNQVYYPANSATAALHLTFPATNNYTITIGAQSLNFYGSQFFLENMSAGLQMVSVRYMTTTANGSAWQTTYNGAVNFEANTRLFATVDAYGVLRITQREAIGQIPPVNPQPLPNVCPTPQQPQILFATQQQADDLVKRLKNVTFDSKKVLTAKNALKSNHYTAQQVKQLLLTFSFDSYKLDVAKYAYDMSYDKANFFAVGDAFSFSSYADELEKYIASK
ncbi:DUF4476 domain-containing protein [Oscillatoria amoena NRMC-F 0135]|nr:DUF4476 domain-containing protein [Oscillatoria amoena NRMC-F 0135]